MSRKAPSASQTLAARHAITFKQVVRCYETKQYKKGIRAADQILKSHGEHGETLAMKGLISNCMGTGPEHQQQALAMIKRGLMLNMQSHVCWHVLGLYHRAATEYASAIKAYLQALRLDNDNVQILRDLSLLQVQIRDLAGYEETRRRLLVLQPSQRQNWLAYSVAACLAEHRGRALAILKAYQGTLDRDRSYDYSEMILFQLQIMSDEDLVDDALQCCREARPYVVDVLALDEREAGLLLRRGIFDQATVIYRQLIENNPDNAAYHQGFRTSSQLTENELMSFYKDLGDSHPSAVLPKVLPLSVTSDRVVFESLVSQYIENGLSASQPSLFKCLRSLYADQLKRDVLSAVIERCIHHHPSTTHSLLLSAQHHDHIGNHPSALSAIDRALETLGENSRDIIDCLLMRGKILKHLGAHVQAHVVVDQARCMDLQDRFLNTKTVKYALRAGKLAEADRVVSLFLRDGDTIISLYDMQCMWYEVALGEAYAREKSYGPALKKFDQIGTHFNDIADDQFDFHMYCLRRQTLCSYVAMLNWEDSLRSHRFSARASRNSVSLYIELYEQSVRSAPNSIGSTADKSTQPADNSEAAAQLKRQNAKARRAQNKALAGANAAANGVDAKDLDPNGYNLVNCKDPLRQALVHVRRLQMCSSNEISSYILASRVYSYLNLPLRVLHSLMQAASLPNAYEDLQFQLALTNFFSNQALTSPSDPIVRQVVSSEIPDLFASRCSTFDQYLEELISKYRASSIYELRVHAVDLILASSSHDSSDDVILSLLLPNDSVDRPSLKSLVKAQSLVTARYPSSLAKFTDVARHLYPMADAFQ